MVFVINGDMAIELPDEELRSLCEYLARGNCSASVDGYCIGGTYDGHCHG